MRLFWVSGSNVSRHDDHDVFLVPDVPSISFPGGNDVSPNKDCRLHGSACRRHPESSGSFHKDIFSGHFPSDDGISRREKKICAMQRSVRILRSAIPCSIPLTAPAAIPRQAMK